MKTKTAVLHRTFEKIKEFKGDSVFYVSTPKGVKRLVGADTDKWLDKLDAKSTLRITATGGFENAIMTLQERGVTVMSAHWHNTNIEKGLPPEEITTKFAELPDDLFTEVKLRKDLFDLKNRVKSRFALMDFRKAVNQRLMQIQRSYGLKDADKLPESLQYLQDDKDEASSVAKESGKLVDKALLESARLVPEYLIVSDILGVDNGFSAAGIVAYIGDPQRFHTVSGLWKYAGQHVVNGKCVKRAVGVKQDWNPNLKTVLWNFVDSAIKNSKKWRPVYEAHVEAELAVHEAKDPGCNNPEGHSKNRARRRIAKDVLKQYFAATHQDRGDKVLIGSAIHAHADKVTTKKLKAASKALTPNH